MSVCVQVSRTGFLWEDEQGSEGGHQSTGVQGQQGEFVDGVKSVHTGHRPSGKARSAVRLTLMSIRAIDTRLEKQKSPAVTPERFSLSV